VQHYDRLLGQVREALPAIGEALGVDVDAVGERLAVKAAWVGEPTLSRGYAERGREQRE